MLTMGSFCRDRIRWEMPWLWDLPAISGDEVSEIDWARVFRELWKASDQKYDGRILGLVNRRRIWTTCLEIAECYWADDEEELEPRRCWPVKLHTCDHDSDAGSDVSNTSHYDYDFYGWDWDIIQD